MAVLETFLKTQQVADALGVSVSTIKRWVDSGVLDATRTMGKHRLVALSSALRFAREGKYPLDGLLAMSRGSSLPAINALTVESLVECLKAGNATEASSVINSAFHSPGGAVALADQLIRPTMERIGHGWMVGAWDVYEEHQGCQVVVSALTDLISKLKRTGLGLRPLAIGAAPEADPYILPVLLGELVLREVGWEVKNLGANLPLRSFAQATRDFRPRMVFLAASHLTDRDGFLHDYPYFYEAASQAGSAIILGGRALDADLRSKLVFASFGERMAHLAEFARRLMSPAEVPFGEATNHSGPMHIST